MDVMNQIDSRLDGAAAAEEPVAKRAHVQPVEDGGVDDKASRPSAFGPSAQRNRSYQEEAAVPSELRSRLESIGMRTRFNVNRGYGTPSISTLNQADLQALACRTASVGGTNRASPLVTENEVLQHVKATRSAWGRAISAPQYVNELQPFGGEHVRPVLLDDAEDVQGMDAENEDPLAAHFHDDQAAQQQSVSPGIGLADLKRPRDAALFDDWTDGGQTVELDGRSSDARMGDTGKPVRNLPTSSRFAHMNAVEGRHASPFGLTRANGATTLPVTAGLTHYLASNAVLPSAQSNSGADDASWAQQNFSVFSQTDDF